MARSLTSLEASGRVERGALNNKEEVKVDLRDSLLKMMIEAASDVRSHPTGYPDH